MRPLDLVASMVLETGHRWGEVATEDQWADMTALLDAPGGPRRHFWLRARGRSKPLSIVSMIPTPSGWTTLGELRPGDQVFSETGLPCTVTFVSEVMHGEDCYRVTFDDHSSLIASGDHEWVVENHRDRAIRNRKGLHSAHMLAVGLAGLRQMTTREMAGKLRYGPRSDLSLSIPCSKEWDLPEAELPLPPYVLGAWLGDGNKGTGRVTIGDGDVAEMSARFEALGYPLSRPTRKPGANCATWRFGTGYGQRKNGRGPHGYDSTRALGALGLINAKRIPPPYLRASAKQRLELLRGLMDTDGHFTCGAVAFNTTCLPLAGDVQELVVSLGWKARRQSGRARLNGKDCGMFFRVAFRPDVSPFHLERKTARLKVTGRSQISRHTSRMIVSVEPVPSEPVRCISVDSLSHLYLAGSAGIPTHNTSDTGAATLAVMLSGEVRPGDEMYAAAAGKEQAGLLARKMQGLTAQTPELAGAVEVQQHRVITRRTGAVLDVLSSELATSWGKTPRWLFIDEICNHESGERDRMFIDALITALIKRRDSVCVTASTPSSPEHWSHDLWEHALASALWRCSVTSGPAPWQDPAELEDERRKLPEFLWKRLFLCEWTAAGDALADDVALSECTRHDGPLPYRDGTACVVSFDLSVSRDHTAVAVAHLGERDGKAEVVVDRLEAWEPRGGQVDLADVESWIGNAAREYGGALIAGDPYQAVSMIGRLREDGHTVKAVTFSSGANSRRAQMLLRLVRDRQLDIPDDPVLRREFLSLRLAEGTSPGVLRLTSDGSSLGHFDRVTAIMLAAEELLSRPQGSWRDYCGKTAECGACGSVYLLASAACVRCQAPNPAYEPRREPVRRAPEPALARPGSWASAYYPKDAMRCPAGHLYSESEGACRQCGGGSGYSGMAAPASFTRALALRR